MQTTIKILETHDNKWENKSRYPLYDPHSGNSHIYSLLLSQVQLPHWEGQTLKVCVSASVWIRSSHLRWIIWLSRLTMLWFTPESSECMACSSDSSQFKFSVAKVSPNLFFIIIILQILFTLSSAVPLPPSYQKILLTFKGPSLSVFHFKNAPHPVFQTGEEFLKHL